jgi:hypothetical protein
MSVEWGKGNCELRMELFELHEEQHYLRSKRSDRALT